MKAVDFMIQQSGVLERLSCTIEQVKELHYLWKQGFNYRDVIALDPIDDKFLSYILRFPQQDNLYNWLLNRLKKDIADTDKSILEIEIKKAAGTYEEWIGQITKQNEESKDIIDSFFAKVSEITSPINISNRQN